MPPRNTKAAGRRRRITQSDLARMLSIDRTSVTKILNNHPHSRFDPKLVERVRQAAREHGYRNLRSVYKEIAFVVERPRPTSYLDPIHYRLLQFILGINDALADRSSKLTLVHPNGDTPPLLETADGVIFLECKHLGLLKHLPAPPPPSIVINRVTPDYKGAYVIHDIEAAHALAVRHLVERGHRKITYLSSAPPSQTRQITAQLDAHLRVHGLSLCHQHVLFGAGHDAPLGQWARGLVEHGVTAVVAAHDVVAFALLRAARQEGLRIPEDLSVIGNNHVPSVQNAEPQLQLTSVTTPWYELARQAATLLSESIRNQQPLTQQVVLPPDLREGNTVAQLD